MKFLFYIFFVFQIFITQTTFAQKISLETFCIEHANQFLRDKGNVGLMIAVLNKDTVSYYSYGSSSKDSLHRIQKNDIFEIGSVTKIFTGIAIAKLIEEGKLSDTSRIQNVLPKDLPILHQNADKMTIAHLLTHYSGFSKLPINFNLKKREEENPYKYYTRADFKQYLGLASENKLWNKEFQYSHSNYTLIGEIIENISQMKYEQYLDSLFFTPLKMNQTKFSLNTNEKKNFVEAHLFNGDKTNHWDFEYMNASIGLKSSANDMMQFIQAFYDEKSNLKNTFKKSTSSLRKTNLKSVFYAYGWQKFILGKKNPVVLTHNGGTGGHRCYLAMLENQKKAVLIFSNSANSPDQIGIDILNFIMDER